MRKELKFIFLLLSLSIFSVNVYGAKRYWISSTAAYWNNTSNWSLSSGGAGGASVPGSSDTAYFDGGIMGTTGDGNDTIDVAVNVRRLEITSNYNGKIIQGANTITIGASGAVLGGGIFSGGSASITASGAVTISGTAFTSTSGTLSLAGNFTLSSSGSFTHNNGKVRFTATGTITNSITGRGLIALYQLELAPASSSTYTITSGDTLSVSNTFTISGSSAAIINTGMIIAHGDISITNTSTTGTGTATLHIRGTGTQTITGTAGVGEGKLPHVVINKSTGTLQLANIISVYGNWTWLAGTISAGTSTVHFANTLTITGKHTLFNVNFSGGGTRTFTIASGDTLTVKGTLATTGANGVTLNTGVINARGDIKIRNTSIASGGTATLYIDSTANQTFTGGATAGEGKVPNIKIHKSSGTLTLDSLISVHGNWTYVTGNLVAGTSTIHFANSLTISGTHTLYNVLFTAAITRTIVIAPGDVLTCDGTLSLTGTADIIINSGTIFAKGNITVTNSGTGANGSASLVINGTTTQQLTGTGTAGQGRLPKITINKSSGTLVLNSVISVAGDWIYSAGTVVSSYMFMGALHTSNVVLYGTGNLNGTGAATMAFYDLTLGGNTRTLTGNIDVNNNLSIESGATLSAGSNTINVGGNWNNSGTWAYSTSTVIMDGSGYNAITKASGTETFYNLRFNRSAKSHKLYNPVAVNNVLTLTKGHVKSTTANYLLLQDNATLVGGNDSAYVHGPVRKTGDDAFTFPLGDTTLADTAYHPLAMTAPSNVGDQFTATYFAINQTYGDSLVDSLASISQCEYWTLGRDSGASTPVVSVGWNKNSCNVDDYDDLRLASWNGVKWLDLGVTSVAVTDYRGTLTGSLPPGYSVNPVPIVTGKKTNSQPYAILKKKPDAGYFQVANGKLMFRFNEEYNDPDAKLSFLIYDDNYQLVGSTANVVPGYEPIVYYGSNYYLLNVLSCNLLPTGGLSNGYYMLEIINDKNEHWYLRFKHTTTIAVICNGNPQ
jgi:hypothetical protein